MSIKIRALHTMIRCDDSRSENFGRPICKECSKPFPCQTIQILSSSPAETTKVSAPAVVPETKYVVGDEVSWDRGNLPDGVGTVTEVEVSSLEKMYKVRDARGNVFIFHEDQIAPESS